MTDRAEIERLLNQTGRTLEGVTEVEIGYGSRINGKTMSIIKHQSDVIELLIGALRDALNERDAAIKDLPRMCYLCKHYFSNPMIKDTKFGKMIIHCDKNCGDARFWEWRGQKKEAAAWET